MTLHSRSAVSARCGDGGLGIAGSTSSNLDENVHTNRSNTGLRLPSVFVRYFTPPFEARGCPLRFPA